MQIFKGWFAGIFVASLQNWLVWVLGLLGEVLLVCVLRKGLRLVLVLGLVALSRSLFERSLGKGVGQSFKDGFAFFCWGLVAVGSLALRACAGGGVGRIFKDGFAFFDWW